MYKEVFKLRIAARREELGLTQGGVAVDTEIGQSKISKYETGNLEPNLETLGKLANYYQVSIDWLLGNPHNGKEGNMAIAILSEYINAITEDFDAIAAQGLTRDEERALQAVAMEDRRNSISEKYADKQ